MLIPQPFSPFFSLAPSLTSAAATVVTFCILFSAAQLATHPVGQKKPNAWGLYDMHGNVWEWCLDWQADSYANAGTRDLQGVASGTIRVLRGGRWDGTPQYCRSASRIRDAPDCRFISVGFRVAVDLK